MIVLSEEQLNELDRLFPPRCVRRNEDLRDADRYAGKRELIDQLWSAHREAEENSAQLSFTRGL